MSTLLKDLYSKSFYDDFAVVLEQTLPSFDKPAYNSLIYNGEFDSYELKERMAHTADVLAHFLPDDFEKAAPQIKQIITQLRKAGVNNDTLEYMFFPDYVARYGLDQFEVSVSAMEFITQFTSCEFAVRPFLLNHKKRMLEQMLTWSDHESEKVRRLASEGSRPRLPWAKGVPALKQEPDLILPILENLKNDPSEDVRRSVANSLNDISKDHPDVVKKIAKRWYGRNKKRDAIVKHGCRTLLKQGDSDILKIFGFDPDQIELHDFKIITPKVKIGKKLEFSFTVENMDQADRLVRLEYAVYYKKKNGSLSKKVFKISEREFEAGSVCGINRKQSFKKITTRTFYPGKHKLSVIVNGRESELLSFDLVQ